MLGQPFFVMDFVDADRGANPSPETGRAFIELLDRMHDLDWQSLGIEFDLVPKTAEEATPMQVERWRNVYRSNSPHAVPLLEEAAAWLTDERSAAGPRPSSCTATRAPATSSIRAARSWP